MESRTRRLMRELLFLSKDLEHHVCAIYNEMDYHQVKWFIQVLENRFRLSVFDPERDGAVNFPVLRNIFEAGIESSKMTILFITKNFLSNNMLMYIAMTAVMKFVTSKGKHRIIPVVLESCKLPEYLRLLSCIPLWKYEQKTNTFSWNVSSYRVQLAGRILKAFIGSPPDYKRIKKIGIKEICTRKPKLWIDQSRRIFLQESRYERSHGNINSPFNLQKLVGILRNVVMVCPFGRCRYACRGHRYLMMYNHLEKSCEYIPRQCEYCSFRAPKRLLTRHSQNCQLKSEKIHNPVTAWLNNVLNPPELNKEIKYVMENKNKTSTSRGMKTFTTSRNSDHRKENQMRKEIRVKCPDCGGHFQESAFHEHQMNCQNALKGCENFGCNFFGTPAEMLGHLVHCKYKHCCCKYAEQGCQFEGTKGEVEIHLVDCEHQPTECPNCKQRFEKHYFQHHIKGCKQNLGTKLKKIFRLKPKPEEKKNISEDHVLHEKINQTPDVFVRPSSEDDDETAVFTTDEWTLLPESQPKPVSKRDSTGNEESSISPLYSASSSSTSSRPSVGRRWSSEAEFINPSLPQVSQSRTKFNKLMSLDKCDTSLSSLRQENDTFRLPRTLSHSSSSYTSYDSYQTYFS